MNKNLVRGLPVSDKAPEARVDCRGDVVDPDVDPEFCPGCGHFGGCFPRDENCGDLRCCQP